MFTLELLVISQRLHTEQSKDLGSLMTQKIRERGKIIVLGTDTNIPYN